jgi:hypothetical protein
MVPSRILCVPRVHVWDSFRFFTFTCSRVWYSCAHTSVLYWSTCRNNKIENRIFCPQESTIAISRCLLLLPAVQSPCCAVYVPDQQCCVLLLRLATVFSSLKLGLFFDQKLIIAPNHASIALPSSFKRVPAIRSAPTRWQK